MSKNDAFPFWSDDWMKSQQEYLDAWTEMSKKMAETLQTPKKPRNPWVEAMEQWESFIPNTGEAEPYAQRMLNQGKAFFEMSEGINRFLSMLNEMNQNTDDWKQALQDQMEELKKVFDMDQGGLATFWNQPLDAWQRAFGDTLPDPETFQQIFDQMKGKELLNPVYDEMNKLLSAPGVGPDRETHEQQRKLLRLWMDYHRAYQDYIEAHHRVAKEAVERLTQKMIERAEAGEPLQSMREVYDLWIDCAEDAYADFAYSEEYQEVYGRLINSLMALKQETRNLVDDFATSLGLPSSKGFDTVLKRLQEMRREIRKLQHNKSPDETAELREEIAALRQELAELKEAIETKTAPPKRAAATKKKVTTIRKKTAKKKAASKTSVKG